MYALVAVGLVVMYALPKVTKAVPAPLVAIVALTAAAAYLSLDVRSVGDVRELPDALPWVALPAVPLTFQTLGIIAPYAVALTFIGLLESLLTAQIVDDMTDTGSDKDRESRGQGIANVATGFLGGMAGCAMIGPADRAARRRALTLRSSDRGGRSSLAGRPHPGPTANGLAASVRRPFATDRAGGGDGKASRKAGMQDQPSSRGGGRP